MQAFTSVCGQKAVLRSLHRNAPQVEMGRVGGTDEYSKAKMNTFQVRKGGVQVIAPSLSRAVKGKAISSWPEPRTCMSNTFQGWSERRAHRDDTEPLDAQL